jgi:leader peptidase (prepilin peptidase)/N-methyltransferase
VLLQLSLLFVLGLLVGSFLNVVAYRLPKGESLVFPGSNCRDCSHALGPLDLIPVLSFLLLYGRCRYCRAPIPWRYPITEIVTGVYFFLAGLTWGFKPILVRQLVCGTILILAAQVDLATLTIPDPLTLGGSVLALFLPPGPHWVYLLGGVTNFLLLSCLTWASHGGIGQGDIKLSLALGLFLGWPFSLVALILAFFFGASVGIVLLLARLKRRNDIVAFGPFLALGGIIAGLWGRDLLELYLTTFWR